eukprot:60098-Chlamydomonas_euryale.AAC.1
MHLPSCLLPPTLPHLRQVLAERGNLHQRGADHGRCGVRVCLEQLVVQHGGVAHVGVVVFKCQRKHRPKQGPEWGRIRAGWRQGSKERREGGGSIPSRMVRKEGKAQSQQGRGWGQGTRQTAGSSLLPRPLLRYECPPPPDQGCANT